MNELLLVFWSYCCVCRYISLAEQVWHKDWCHWLAVEPLWKTVLSLLQEEACIPVNCSIYLVRHGIRFTEVWCTSACFSMVILSMPYFRITSFYLLFKVLGRLKKCKGWFFKRILILRMRIISSAFNGAVHISNVKCTLAHLDLFVSVPQFSLKLVWTFTLHFVKLWIKPSYTY